MALWCRLADSSDMSLTRMAEAEEIALEQVRLIGHTFLIYMTAGRYRAGAEDQCGLPDSECRAANANFQRAAAWYRLGESSVIRYARWDSRNQAGTQSQTLRRRTLMRKHSS